MSNSAAHSPQAAQTELSSLKVEQVQKSQKAQLTKVNASSKSDGLSSKPDSSEAVFKISHALEGVENHWNSVGNVLKTAFSKKLDMQDCIKLQVMVQKYTMELDLTGKVVEKATTGLKDTLKTQV